MLRKKIKNSAIYVFVFLLFGYIFSEVLNFLEMEDVSNIGYRLSKIEDFTLYSHGKENYKVSGDYIVDYGKKIYIFNPDIQIYSESESSYIKSKEALYYPKENLVKLIGDVKVTSGKTALETPYLNIMIEKSVAYNYTENTIFINSVKMYGRNLIFEIKNKNILLEKVKTEVYGSNG